MNRMQSSGTRETGKENYLDMVLREDILEKNNLFEAWMVRRIWGRDFEA